jgi:hypothetical protein
MVISMVNYPIPVYNFSMTNLRKLINKCRIMITKEKISVKE